MTKLCDGVCVNCDCSEDAQENIPEITKTRDQIRIENLEKALYTLKSIAQGYGSNPMIYARNTLKEIGESY